jgi:predicted TIM-barrel fold metal-dependent hydrolase
LQLVVGHLGQAPPFWLYRLDYMHSATVRSECYECLKPLQRKVSDYLQENVWVTTSGMAWAPAIMFCRQVLGPDRVLYAMDYPYVRPRGGHHPRWIALGAGRAENILPNHRRERLSPLKAAHEIDH